MYTEGAIQFYNLFYTAVPIVLYGVYDTDLPSKVIYKYPQLYKSGIENLKFNVRFLLLLSIYFVIKCITFKYSP